MGFSSTPVVEADATSVTFKAAVNPGFLLAIRREGKFVAVVQVTDVVEGRARGRVWRGIAVDKVRAGDEAHVIQDIGAFVAQLPAEAKIDLGSRRSQEEMRVKLGY